MTAIPTELPRFSALYKSAEAQRKGDKVVAAASAVGGAATFATATTTPSSPLLLLTFGVGLMVEGVARLIFKLKRQPTEKPLNNAALDASLAATTIAAAPASPVSVGFASGMLGASLGHLYDHVKGTPEDVKTPE